MTLLSAGVIIPNVTAKSYSVYKIAWAIVNDTVSSTCGDTVLSLSLQEDLTLEGYNKHLESQKAAPPLTDAEHELKLLRESEVNIWSFLAMRQ